MKCVFILPLLLLSVLSVCSQSKRVLFIGNSYIYVNDLPTLLKQAALSTNDTIITDQYTPGGFTFEQHSVDLNIISKIALGNWDVVAMQEQSQRPSFPFSQVQTQVFPFAKKLDSLVQAYNTCAKTMYYMTWGRKNGDAGNCANFPPLCTYSGMDSLLRLRYDMMAVDNKATVAPVGPLWRYIRSNHPAIELYQADESHPSLAGSYAAACAFYTSILRKNPTSITYVPTGLSAADAQTIRNAAKIVAFDSMTNWYINAYDAKANFNASTLVNNSISISNTSTNATNYTWYFGDGQTSNVAAPSHTYAQGGSYMVTLVASNCFSKDSTQKIISFDPSAIQNTDVHNLFSIYPNPSNGKLYLELFNVDDLANIIVQDVMGQQFKVHPTMYNKDYAEINLQSLPTGIYYIKLTSKDKSQTTKFMKQ